MAALGALGLSSVSLVQRVSSAVLISVSSTSSALSAYLAVRAGITDNCAPPRPFDFDDDTEGAEGVPGSDEAATPAARPALLSRLLSGAAYVLQVRTLRLCNSHSAHPELLIGVSYPQAVASTSRVGARALEQRTLPPQPEHLLGGAFEVARTPSIDLAGDCGRQMASASTLPHRVAIAGLDRHALVLCRDFGPDDGGVSEGGVPLEIRVCVQFDGEDWQRGVLLLEAYRNAAQLPNAEAAPRGEVVEPAAPGDDGSAGYALVPHAAELREIGSLSVLDEHAYGRVLVDSIPAVRVVSGTVACDVRAGLPETFLLKGSGVAFAVPLSARDLLAARLSMSLIDPLQARPRAAASPHSAGDR